MKHEWNFTSNTFDVATQTSNKKMLTIAADTDSKLEGQISDPAINAIYTIYHPVFDLYRTISQNYDAIAGDAKAKTEELQDKMHIDLPEKVRQWQPAVFVVFPEGSTQANELFPDGRKPFHTGTYQQRINAVGTLKNKLNAIPAFVMLAMQVQTFYNELVGIRNVQEQKEGLLKTLSSQRDNQRKLVAQFLYGTVLAGLMTKFAADPAQIDNYFDLSLIRHHAESVTATEDIVKGKVTISDTDTPVAKVEVKLYSNGEYIKSAYTTAKGNYKFKLTNVQPGIASVVLKVDAPGCEHFELPFDGTAGEIYVKNISLTPAQSMLKVA